MTQLIMGAPNPVAYVPQQHDELEGTDIVSRARKLYSWWQWMQGSPAMVDMFRRVCCAHTCDSIMQGQQGPALVPLLMHASCMTHADSRAHEARTAHGAGMPS